jgi:hypothetical protein
MSTLGLRKAPDRSDCEEKFMAAGAVSGIPLPSASSRKTPPLLLAAPVSLNACSRYAFA